MTVAAAALTAPLRYFRARSLTTRSAFVSLCVAAPMLVCALVLVWRPWVPVLDMAMTEMRVRDVGTRNSPLIGLLGRIGTFPNQGSHPGPWSFYLIATVYRLTGSSAWSLEFASVVINSAGLALCGALLTRRFGPRGLLIGAFGGAVMVRGYGMTVLTQPWNPYFPVVIWLLAVIAAWLVLDGSDGLLPVVVATTTIAAQTHVSYLLPSVVIDAGLIAVVALRRRAHMRQSVAIRPRGDLRSLILAISIGLLMWVPPVVQELRRRPGNISAMLDYFTGPPAEPLVGFRDGFGVLTQHFNLIALTGELLSTDHAFIARASAGTSISTVGFVILAVWIAAGIWTMRHGSAGLRRAFALGAALVAVDWLIIARIYGRPWFYLTLWMPTTVVFVVATALVAGQQALTAASSQADSVPDSVPNSDASWIAGVTTERMRRWHTRVSAAAVGAAAVMLILAATDALTYQVPERAQGEPVRQLMPIVTDGLESDVQGATGHSGRYVVYWEEAVFSGSQGLALVNELERRGYDVGVDPIWRVAGTPHRVLHPGEATAALFLASGPWIEDWGARPELTKLGEADARTEAERVRFDELQQDVVDRLRRFGRDDLIPDAYRRIFALSTNPDVPVAVRELLEEMITIGVPVAVFIGPAS